MSSYLVKVSRLPWTVGAKELKTYCSAFGPVQSVRVPIDYTTGFQYGFGWIRFADNESKTRFLEKKHYLEGNQLTVDGTVKKLE